MEQVSLRTWERSRSVPLIFAAKHPCFFPKASVMTSPHVTPAAYSFTVPSGKVM